MGFTSVYMPEATSLIKLHVLGPIKAPTLYVLLFSWDTKFHSLLIWSWPRNDQTVRVWAKVKGHMCSTTKFTRCELYKLNFPKFCECLHSCVYRPFQTLCHSTIVLWHSIPGRRKLINVKGQIREWSCPGKCLTNIICYVINSSKLDFFLPGPQAKGIWETGSPPPSPSPPCWRALHTFDTISEMLHKINWEY